MKSETLSLAILLLVGAASGSTARCQCSPVWSSAAPEAQLTGGFANCSTLWDPDGSGGPLPLRLVVGGTSLLGGAAAGAQKVMTWDGSQWQSLGSGPGTLGEVYSLTTWNGLLVAAGSFTGGGINRIALWNGSAWQALGPGLTSVPIAIAEWNGNLVAAVNTAGSPVISLWNGAAWSALPSPPTTTSVRALTPFQGLLCVGGAGSTSTNGAIERWNGTTWLSTIAANGIVNTLGVRSFQLTSWLYAGGLFGNIGGTSVVGVASTSGGTAFAWNAVGTGVIGTCLELHVRATSPLGAAVVVRTNSATAPVMQLSGNTFVAMGNTPLSSLSYYGGSYHGTCSGTGVAACRRFDGTNWVPELGHSIDGEVRALTRSGPDVIVGGTIQATSGALLNRIARWNGSSFQSLGTGVAGASVDALASLDNGDVIAAGVFTMAGGLFANNIARWNGTAWSPLGAGCDQQVLALCKMPNGDLIAGGKFTTAGGVPCAHIARWNGAAWSPLGLGMNGDVLALAVRSDGILFAGGSFTLAGTSTCTHIAQWNGTTWSPLVFGTNGDVCALAVRPNDDVVVAGAFTTAIGVFTDRCFRWTTGNTWVPMGASSADPSPVRSLFVLPNGDVVAGRGFHQPPANPDAAISRWNPAAGWSAFDTGLASLTPGAAVASRALTQRADGVLVVGGDFGIAGGFVAHGLATLSATCQATASSYGAGCSSTAGPLVITADTLPWIGATFRTTTTGVAPGALCLGLTGLTQLSIPLASLLVEGQPGCSLLSSLDILSVLTPGPGNSATSLFALANDPSLLGVHFYQQTLPLEFDLAGALVAVRGSNALALTIGTL